jgi:hypothetical protein
MVGAPDDQLFAVFSTVHLWSAYMRLRLSSMAQYSSASMSVRTRAILDGSDGSSEIAHVLVAVTDLKEQFVTFDLNTAEVVLAVRVIVFDEDIECVDPGKRGLRDCVA